MVAGYCGSEAAFAPVFLAAQAYRLQGREKRKVKLHHPHAYNFKPLPMTRPALPSFRQNRQPQLSKKGAALLMLFAAY